MRKGRSAQLDDKRFQAISDYQEIIDYFPNEVKYAAAALYFLGDCHRRNGDMEKAVEAWGKLAEDVDYRQEPLGAVAVNYLADYLVRQGKEAGAVKYFRQVAIDFRRENPEASEHASNRVVAHYVRASPSEPEFQSFYREMGTLDDRPETVPRNLDSDHEYWDTLRREIRRYGKFDPSDEDARKAYYTYWADQMRDKFTDDIGYGDDFHIERANYLLAANGDEGEWIRMLDNRYERLQSRAGWERTVKWIRLHEGRQAKVEQYFAKLEPGKLEKEALVAAMKAVWETPEARPLAHRLIDHLPLAEMSTKELGELAVAFHQPDHKLTSRFLGKINFDKMEGSDIASLAVEFLARHDDKLITQSLLRKMRWDELTDEQIARIADHFFRHDGEIVKAVCGRIRDKALGHWKLLQYYRSRYGRNPKAALPLADALVHVEEYASDAWWAKAESHQQLGQYQEAIPAYRNCQNPPKNLWHIANCQVELGKLDRAVAQLREIANFFPDEAPKAALRIAHLYRDAGEKKQYIQALRAVLKKYPQSGESKEAHVELERANVKMGGGIDAE